MLCPYCLHDSAVKDGKCPDCDKELPRLYIQNYQRRRPPVVLSAVGFSGHGKTVYLAALLHALQSSLPRPCVWPGFYRQGLDMDAIQTVRENLKMLEQGDLPESTRRNFPQPSIHMLAKMPKYKDRQLIIYDPPGEAFEEDLRMEQYAGFVIRAKAVLFLISLTDLEDPIAGDMHRLLEVYTLGMDRLGATTKKQHLVVAFTKADLLLGSYLQDYPALVAYLQESQWDEIGQVKSYLKKLNGLSEQLAGFTRDLLRADTFANLAEDKFKSVTYCMVSALGSPPDGNRLSQVMKPRRVADPLLWILEKSR